MLVGDRVLLIVGGSRGISEALCVRFRKSGYSLVVLSRQKPEFDVAKHFYLDIDDLSIVSAAFNQLKEFLKDRDCKHISTHFVTGGSLKISDNSPCSEISKYKMITWHNLGFPYWATQFIINNVSCNEEVDWLYNYYSSAVIRNFSSHPLYSASKAGLESMFKSLVNTAGNKQYFFCFRLGMVGVKHKFFYELSKADPSKFQTILDKNVPSGFFTTPESLADLVYSMHEHKSICHGMISDISGGNSWIEK